MTELRLRLFRKLEIQCDGHILADINARKVQELSCHLLLHPDRPHHREILASLLWREKSVAPALPLQEAQRWLRDTTNEEKAEYFKRDIPALSEMRMPEPIAAAFFNYVMERRPRARDFEHPFHWAGFCLTGV